MAKKIVVTSGKGGVGKTTLTANLGITLSDYGKRVALIDVDFGLNNLDVVLGLENKIVFDMQDVFDGKCRIKQALIQDEYRKNLYILPSGRLHSNSNVNGQNIKLLIEGISSLFDYILIDCPAGIDVGFHRAVSCADQAILVTTPTLSSLRDASKTLSILKSYKLDDIGLVVNRARGDLMLNEKMMHPLEIKDILQTKLIGVLPEEDIVFLSSGGLPKFTDSYKSYKLIAGNIIGVTNKVFDATKKYKGFLGSIKRSLRNNIWRT